MYMIDFSTKWLGLDLPSPLVVGASPLADDLEMAEALVAAGAGAIVMHSLFEEQITAEQMAAHHYLDSWIDFNAEARSFLPDSEVFSLGAEPYLDYLTQLRKRVDVPILASLNGVTPGGWISIAKQMEDAGASALELNLYEVVTRTELESSSLEARQLKTVESVVKSVTIPVSVKLSPFYSSLPSFTYKLAQLGVKGVVVFNRFYQPDINLETFEVDRTLHLSTPQELPLRLHALAVLFGQNSLSLAASGGVHSGRDVAKAIVCGADVVQMVSALLGDGPRKLATVAVELQTWLSEQGYKSLKEARGVMSFHQAPDPAAWERVNYFRMLQGWTKVLNRP
jgi:dihydroorotate dehydrogenase (fumarate)